MVNIKPYAASMIDIELSSNYAKRFNCSPRECYANVYTVVTELFENGELPSEINIAYGYYGDPEVVMTRHCFMINGENVVDPTSYESACIHDYTYHIFKQYSMREYMQCLLNYYSIVPEEYVPWFEYCIPEEKDYFEFLINERIPVHKFSYDNFLRKYDINQTKLIIFDETIK